MVQTTTAIAPTDEVRKSPRHTATPEPGRLKTGKIRNTVATRRRCRISPIPALMLVECSQLKTSSVAHPSHSQQMRGRSRGAPSRIIRLILSANTTTRRNSLTAIDRGTAHRPAIAARMSKRLFKVLARPIRRTEAAQANLVGRNVEAETEIDRPKATRRSLSCRWDDGKEEGRTTPLLSRTDEIQGCNGFADTKSARTTIQ